MPYARSLAHAHGGLQDEEKNLLLPPFTPRPYYLGYRDYIILFGIYIVGERSNLKKFPTHTQDHGDA